MGLDDSAAEIEKNRKKAKEREAEQSTDKLRPGFHEAANENRRQP